MALLGLWSKLHITVTLLRIFNMSFDLDSLLNIPKVTVETCSYQNNEVYL